MLALAVEGACRLLDVGRATTVDDPFVGFSEIHPLFEVDGHRGVYRVAPSRRRFFAYESFPVAKEPRTFRIFCLGGSTVKGEPYSIPTSFTTWLELALREADPRYDWEVVNCGGISYATYRLVPILDECLQYQPDLIIFCEGHNEFLEDRTYGHLKDPAALAAAQQAASGWRTFNLVRQGVDALRGLTAPAIPHDRPVLGWETDPILDYHDSLAAYHWDDEWRRGVVAHFEFNLRRIVAKCRTAGVPLLMVQPPSNLGDCPPFKSEHARPLSDDDQRRWTELREEAQRSYDDNLQQAIVCLTEAAEIDPTFARVLYDLGKSWQTAGRPNEAREWLVRARDCDVVPLRMISPLRAAMSRVATETGTPLLDAHALLERQTPQGILDDSLLVDHIHPGFAGHQQIADALVELMTTEGLASPVADWRDRAQAAYARHFAALDYPYFARGQRFLKSLEGWTQGRGDGPPAATRFPGRISDAAHP